ncbi:MAG TPA: sulfur transferase domain-containing protein [Planctomycetota bacterium]|nr:sulfur transferase domain-containing protein [Planctomycetota bacterium]
MPTPRPLAATLLAAPLITLLAALLALPACNTGAEEAETPDDEAAEPATPAGPLPIVAADIPGLPASFAIGDVIVCGQPTPEGLVNARDQGARLLINARTQAEMSYDERSVAQGLGLRYVSLAFTPDTLSDQLVDLFIFEMKKHKPEDGKIVLHCSSGNRVAALWAMYEIKELKVDPELAVQRAREMQPALSTDMVMYIGDYARRTGAL